MKVKAPAKVKAGSVWTLELGASGCESDSFATHHAFSDAITDGTGDHGTYKGTKKLTVTWTAGTASGNAFKGKWSKTTGDYTGTYSLSGQIMAATLVPVASAGCDTETTSPVIFSIALGASDADAATVTGESGITPTGTVHFYVCPSATDPCTTGSAGVVDLGTSPISGSAGSSSADTTSVTFKPSAVGSYCFLGVYSGDDHYPSASDGSTPVECFSVGTTTPTVTTKPTASTIILGSSDSDSATVTGTAGVTPTGSIHFYVCSGASNPCTSGTSVQGGKDLGLSPLSAGTAAAQAVATSDAFTPTATGSYCFLGVYSGDSNYATASDGSTADECFTVTTNTPNVTTEPDPAYFDIGASTRDTATVTGANGVTPTGTVTFYVCGPEATPGANPCVAAGDNALGSPVTVAGSGSTATATSASFTPSNIGLYCFLGVYSGDTHYTSASDGSTSDECFNVEPNAL